MRFWCRYGISLINECYKPSSQYDIHVISSSPTFSVPAKNNGKQPDVRAMSHEPRAVSIYSRQSTCHSRCILQNTRMRIAFCTKMNICKMSTFDHKLYWEWAWATDNGVLDGAVAQLTYSQPNTLTHKHARAKGDAEDSRWALNGG